MISNPHSFFNSNNCKLKIFHLSLVFLTFFSWTLWDQPPGLGFRRLERQYSYFPLWVTSIFGYPVTQLHYKTHSKSALTPKRQSNVQTCFEARLPIKLAKLRLFAQATDSSPEITRYGTSASESLAACPGQSTVKRQRDEN